jgi:diaminopimelate epimerase
MHGTGNDFVLVVERGKRDRVVWTKRRVLALCDRHSGIGADGLVVLTPTARHGPCAFTIYNADGSPAETCVNGLRCAAFLLAGKTQDITFHTLAGPVGTQVLRIRGDTAVVRVDLGPGEYAAVALPPLLVGKARFPVTALSIGNPHVVVFVPAFDFDWQMAAVFVQQRAGRSRGVNVEFARVINRRRIELRIFERGVGPTLSSGSGATASVLAAMRDDLVGNNVEVVMPGGHLQVAYDPQMDRMFLTGPATRVYSGQVEIN